MSKLSWHILREAASFNYVYATASRISRRDFSRPFVPSCLLLTSVSFNFNPPVRILQGSTCVGLGFSFAWTVFVQAPPWVFAFQQVEHFQGGCVCVRATHRCRLGTLEQRPLAGNQP